MLRRGWVRALGPIVLLVLWQVAGSTGVVPADTVSTPLEVAHEFVRVSEGGVLADNVLVSLRRAILGFVLGAALGVGFGVLTSTWRVADAALDSTFRMTQAIPWPALLPLFILWMGLDELPKVVFVATATFFPMYINTYAGIRDVDMKLVEAGRVLGLNRWGIITQIVFPGAVPSILVGLRYALIYAVMSLVIAEQIGADSGIGYLLAQAQQYIQTPLIMVAIVLYAVMGLAADSLVRFLERVLLPWRRNFTGE
nr:hypothetical protein ISGA_5114 [Gordonia sp. NB41Y]